MIEGGRIKRVSAAVLVDGVYSKNEKGESVYQPRSKEEIDRIAALVRSAIGFDQKRGDQIEVVNLRFAEMPVNVVNEPTGWLSMFAFTKADLMRGVELGVLALVSGLVVLFVCGRWSRASSSRMRTAADSFEPWWRRRLRSPRLGPPSCSSPHPRSRYRCRRVRPRK